MKPKYISVLDYDLNNPARIEIVAGKSQTVQGESYTIRELFERHVRGQLPNLSDQSYWMDNQNFDSIDFQALKNADPHDRAELLADVEHKAKVARESLQKWMDEQKQQLDDDEDKNVHYKKTSSKATRSDQDSSDDEGKDEAKRKDEAKSKSSK